LELLKLLIYTRDFREGWSIDDPTRFLYANMRVFHQWVYTRRRVDSLALQMRIWLKRDIRPVVVQTRFFTVPLPSTFPARRRLAALRLIQGVRDWVDAGAALDDGLVLSSPELQLSQFGPTATEWLKCGMRNWHAYRQGESRPQQQQPLPMPPQSVAAAEEEENARDYSSWTEAEEKKEEEDRREYEQLACLLTML
jgi:hypothetical protein